MLVKKYKSRVVSVINPIDGVYTVEFESLAGKFTYNPGQFLHLSLDSEYDGSGQWPESRCFSIQSNPDDPTIRITYSVKGRFTADMQKCLKSGYVLWLKLPFGDLFSQKHNKVNTVFIAGGTGITPFLSLFTSGLFSQYEAPRIYLGFRSEEHNIYNDYLKKLKMNNVFIYYENVNGSLDIETICTVNGTNCDYFISGPPAMVNAFKNKMAMNDIRAEQIFTDDWE